jgi:hypothetical protein
MSDTMASLHAWIWKLRTEKPSLGSHSMKDGISLASVSRISPGATAPFNLDVLRLPPVLTSVMLRRHLGVLRTLLRRDEKKASWIWFSECRPCNHGNTCSGLGSGCVAMCSSASAILSAVMVYTGGSSEYSVQYAFGGWVIEDVSIRLSCRGGDAGGVAGRPPGEHTGMCLFGMAVGVPRDDVLSDRCGGGVDERGICGVLATAAAMLAFEGTGQHVGSCTPRGRLAAKEARLILDENDVN